MAVANSAELATRDHAAVVATYELQKNYRTGFWLNQTVSSLQDCSLQVYRGETFGLLGPNGAGKTTLLKILLGIVRPTSGRAMVLGQPIGDRPTKQRIGYLPETASLYDYLTGWELLSFVAGLFGIPRSVQKQRIPELLDLVGMAQSAAKRKQLRHYSKGMVQRIGLAQALINDPELVFLDEPMSGLDPLGRYQIREIILALKEKGKTIFFNSHILSDVEQICDRVAILAQGNLLCVGSLQELLGSASAYHASVQGGNSKVLETRLADLQFKDGCWQGYVLGSPQDFLASLDLMGAKLIEMRLARPSLEDFFVQQLHERGLRTSV
jgi:ABC-2 type transport system ATP-binding protein